MSMGIVSPILTRTVLCGLSIVLLAGCATIDDPNPTTRLKALQRITDQALLAKLACEDKDAEVRAVAVERLTDQNVLAKVACEAKASFVRKAAANRLTDQNVLAKLVCEDKDWSVRKAAVERLTDQNLLAKVACEAENALVREAVVKRLKDQNLLAKLACEDKDWSVRKASLIKIDSAHLAVLAKETKDPAVALAARIKLNQENWDIAFSPAKLNQAELGTVLGAVALVDNPQPNTASVVAACHAFIRQGDSSRIPELRDLLVRFGNKPLAEDYLKCGQDQLHDAGVEWARAHGLNVGADIGSNRVRELSSSSPGGLTTTAKGGLTTSGTFGVTSITRGPNGGLQMTSDPVVFSGSYIVFLPSAGTAIALTSGMTKEDLETACRAKGIIIEKKSDDCWLIGDKTIVFENNELRKMNP